MAAWNSCGGTKTAYIGPTMTNFIQPFDLTDISSVSPYKDGKTTLLDYQANTDDNGDDLDKRIVKRHTKIALPLTLSDLYSDCPTKDINSLFEQQKSMTGNTTMSWWVRDKVVHPREYYRCNPYLSIPPVVKEFGGPYWCGCSIYAASVGMPDPPIPLEWNANLYPTTPDGPVVLTPSPPVPAASPNPPSAPKTAPDPNPTFPVNAPQNNNPSSQTVNNPAPNDPKPLDDPSPNKPSSNDLRPVSNPPPVNINTPTNKNGDSANDPSNNNPTTNEPQPGNSDLSTSKNNIQPTNNPLSNKPQLNNPGPPVVASSFPDDSQQNDNNAVYSAPPNNQGSPNFNGPPQNNPEAGPSQESTFIPVATYGSNNIISAIPAAGKNVNAAPTYILPGGSTLQPGQIFTASSGLQGKPILVSLSPTPISDPNNDANNQNLIISTLGAPMGTTITRHMLANANPTLIPSQDIETVLYNSQTLIVGGPVITLADKNAVATYGSQEVVVQYPSGVVSTIPVLGVSLTTSTSGGNGNGNDAEMAGLINSFVNGVPVSGNSGPKTLVLGQVLPGRPTSLGLANGTGGNGSVAFTGGGEKIRVGEFCWMGIFSFVFAWIFPRQGWQ